MKPICFSDNESIMSSDTSELVPNFREIVLIVTSGFPGYMMNPRVLLCWAWEEVSRRNTKFHTCSQLCIILWYKGFFNIMEWCFLPYLYKDTPKWNGVPNKISIDKLKVTACIWNPNTLDAGAVWLSVWGQPGTHSEF